MANELFQFTIIDYTTNPLGDSTIIDEPIGWDGVEFELQRLPTHGFANKINIDGIEFEFHGIAKYLLDNLYENFGTEAKVELQIEWRGNPADAFQVIYKGLFKFSTYSTNCGLDCSTKCGVAQDGCYYLFANRKNQSVDLSNILSFDGQPMTGYANINCPIVLTPKALKFQNKSTTNSVVLNYHDIDYKGQGYNGTYYTSDNIVITLPHKNVMYDEIKDQYHPDQFWNDEAYKVNGVAKGTMAYQVSNELTAPQLLLDKVKKLKCDNTYTLDIDVDLSFTMYSNNFSQLFFFAYASFDVFLYSLDYTKPTIPIFNGTKHPGPFYFTGANTFTINISETINETFTIPEGYYLAYNLGITQAMRDLFVQKFNIDVTINNFDYHLVNFSECSPNEAKISMVNEVLSRQVEAYTNDCMRVKSDYFGRTDSDPYVSDVDGCGSLEALTNGLKVRGAFNESQTEFPFKVSFDDVFNGLTKIHNLGYGLEADVVRGGTYKWLRVEPFKYFYQNTIIKYCDFPNIVTKKIDTSTTFSKILIGYSKWESTEAGGLQDIFTEREYKTNLTRTNNEIDIRSNIIASDFALEVTRRLYGVTNIDWRYDNDIFILCVKRGGLFYELELGSDIIDSSTFIHSKDTLKNARITPIRNLLRHIPALVEYINPSTTYELKFANGKGNYIASIKLNNQDCVLEELDLINENADIDIEVFHEPIDGTPTMRNETIEFDYPMNCAEWAIILANPYGKIAYICPNDPDYSYGYIKQLKFKPTQGIATFTLKKTYP